jgi:hypothetical protein
MVSGLTVVNSLELPISECGTALFAEYAEVIPGNESTIITQTAANHANILQQTWTSPPSLLAVKTPLDGGSMNVSVKVIDNNGTKECAIETASGVPPPKVPLSHSSCVKVLYDRHMEVRTDQNNNNGADVDVTTVPTNFAGNLKMAKEHQNKAQTDTSFGANLNDTEVSVLLKVNSRAYCQKIDVSTDLTGMDHFFSFPSCQLNAMSGRSVVTERIIPP